MKTAKRLLMSNTSPTGSLDHDRFLRAMIQLRNTLDPDCDLSPAQTVYGRPLRGSLFFRQQASEVLGLSCAPALAPGVGGEGGCSSDPDVPYQRIPGGLREATPPIGTRCEGISLESAGPEP